MTLMSERKWLEAMDVIEALVKPATAVGGDPLLSALKQLCEAKLGTVTKPAASAQQAGKAGARHPAQHLASACAADAAAAAQPQNGSLQAVQQARAQAARATAEALAFLLHPQAAEHAALQPLAFEVLQAHGPTLSKSAASAAAASGSASAGGTSAVNAAWRKRAEKSPALKELLELTGLAPVKKEMFSLADQVWACTRQASTCISAFLNCKALPCVRFAVRLCCVCT